MHYLPVSDAATRQAIDAAAIHAEWMRAAAQAKRMAGTMYFKSEGGYEYLVKTLPDKRQQRIGRRTAETEATCRAFMEAKQQAEARKRALDDALREAERLNKALKVGRVPNVVINVLNMLDDAGLAAHFTVVGTHALYAYEAAASVRIQAGALATQDVDLLWDARKRVQFVSTMTRLDSSMLKLLKRADRSFRRMDDQLESVINDKGFMVDFLRRVATADDLHPFRFTQDEDDIWPVQAQRADAFLNEPGFEQTIVSVTGHMAVMRTIAPTVFVAFKRWMAELEARPPGKRRRDKLQADIVQQMLDEQLLIS